MLCIVTETSGSRDHKSRRKRSELRNRGRRRNGEKVVAVVEMVVKAVPAFSGLSLGF